MKSVRIVILLYIVTAVLLQGAMLLADEDPDNFSRMAKDMKRVTATNCWSKSLGELQLSRDSVTHVPIYNKLFSHATHANRSALLHLHNGALNRAFYYSFMYQRLNHSFDKENQPDLMHLYMSSAADVSANQGWIDGSALMFDKNCAYSNWMPYLTFNKTLSLFGVRAWTGEDKFDTHWMREPVNSTNDELMSNHAFKDDPYKNYTAPWYKYCPYTRYDNHFWWPDDRGYRDTITKWTYSVDVKFSDIRGKFKTDKFESIRFYGPSSPLEENGLISPVLITGPYFDCGRSNNWIVSMTSPVIEYMVRYSAWTYLRRPRFVAIAAMDMEFEKIDINPCRLSIGNPAPNLFADTARCRLDTTVCEPLSGFGFQRGGYQCVCREGLYYPWGQEGPFQGVDIEQATEEEYQSGAFDCVAVEDMRNYNGTKPVSHGMKKQHELLDEDQWTKAKIILQDAQSVPSTCDKPVSLTDYVVSGAAEQFEAQGRAALRIAHFLSNFLQNGRALHDVLYTIGEYMKQPRDHYLKEIYVFADVIAAIMSDIRLSGVGVYFDRNKFSSNGGVTKELFAPFAYKLPSSNEYEQFEYKSIDLAGIGSYPNQSWFTTMKQKWTNNFERLEHFGEANAFDPSTKINYRAPLYTDGDWSGPTFKCDEMLTDWVFTYTVPFFGPTSSGADLEFKGVVAVDVNLDFLDINQCPDENAKNNAFTSTAKCDFDTQYCAPVPGNGFVLGSYHCVYRQGYEYPSANHTNKVDGQTMEIEHEKKSNGEPHGLDGLKGKKIPVATPESTTKSGISAASEVLVSHIILFFLIPVVHISYLL